MLSNVEKAFKSLASLKPSLALETPLSTSIPQIDQQIKTLNKAKSQLDSIEDDTEPVVKAGQKLLRTGEWTIKNLEVAKRSKQLLFFSRF